MFRIRQAVGRSQMYFKIDVLKNFANSTGKNPVLASLFNKVAKLKSSATLLKEGCGTDLFQ